MKIDRKERRKEGREEGRKEERKERRKEGRKEGRKGGKKEGRKEERKEGPTELEEVRNGRRVFLVDLAAFPCFGFARRKNYGVGQRNSIRLNVPVCTSK